MFIQIFIFKIYFLLRNNLINFIPLLTIILISSLVERTYNEYFDPLIFVLIFTFFKFDKNCMIDKKHSVFFIVLFFISFTNKISASQKKQSSRLQSLDHLDHVAHEINDYYDKTVETCEFLHLVFLRMKTKVRNLKEKWVEKKNASKATKAIKENKSNRVSFDLIELNVYGETIQTWKINAKLKNS